LGVWEEGFWESLLAAGSLAPAVASPLFMAWESAMLEGREDLKDVPGGVCTSSIAGRQP